MKIKNFFKNLFKDLSVIIGFIFIIILLANIFRKYINKNAALWQIIIFSVASLYLLIVYRKEFKTYFLDFKKNYKSHLSKGFKIYIICLFFMYVSNILIYYLTKSLATNETMNRESVSQNLLLSIIDMCILAPFYEETLSRLNFKNLFSNKWVFSIITGLAFGSLHLLVAESLVECLYLIPYSIMGFSLGYMFYDTDNIFTSMSFHFLNNLVSILLLIL